MADSKNDGESDREGAQRDSKGKARPICAGNIVATLTKSGFNLEREHVAVFESFGINGDCLIANVASESVPLPAWVCANVDVGESRIVNAIRDESRWESDHDAGYYA